MPLSFPAKLQVIIFDCDGVLFDSRRSNQFFYNHLLSHFGRASLSEENLTYVHMHTVTESVDYLFEDESTRAMANTYRQTLDYTPFIQKMDMEPGLIDFLIFIRPWVKTAICTNRTTTIDHVLKMFALNDHFDLVVSALDVKRPKPDPESIYRILTFFDVKPENCLYIGDSEVDALTAGSAGVPLVAFKNANLSADLHVRGFLELQNYLTLNTFY
ncbi:MAG: beta-phosphoglucomutase [Desulfobacca sp.]|nr:beta-phosphoglucomutase [Desulfobacca sp.]